MAGNQPRSWTWTWKWDKHYAHPNSVSHTHSSAYALLTWVSNDEVNFIKQQMREEKVEDVIFQWGHVLFMLSVDTLVKSQECK